VKGVEAELYPDLWFYRRKSDFFSVLFSVLKGNLMRCGGYIAVSDY
jgi:hypothetical protein